MRVGVKISWKVDFRGTKFPSPFFNCYTVYMITCQSSSFPLKSGVSSLAPEGLPSMSTCIGSYMMLIKALQLKKIQLK